MEMMNIEMSACIKRCLIAALAVIIGNASVFAKDVKLGPGDRCEELKSNEHYVQLSPSIIEAEDSIAERYAIVPWPREFKPVSGELLIRPTVSWSAAEWYDFDRLGEAIKEIPKKVVRERSLPPEGYRLRVMQDGVEIVAADEAGEFYALTTLRQLVSSQETNSVAFSCCEISDYPAYRWRGVLVDEGRTFLGKEMMKKILDAMAMHKLNVLHWHLTEDQGWRIELKRHPEITRHGAMRSRSVGFGAHASWLPPKRSLEFLNINDECYGPFFYKQDDIRDILAYAKVRHITVVPEVELPGHVSALLSSHPELICNGKTAPKEPAVTWGVKSEVLCVGNPQTLELLEDIFAELCELFADAPFIHIGGDECPRDNWKDCPRCQALMKREGMKKEAELQTYITSKIVRFLEKKGRRAVGWDEILAGDVPVSTVGQVWRSSARAGAGTEFVSTEEAIKRGHDMVISPSSYCYFNMPQGLKHDSYPYYSPWKGHEITLEKAYEYNPMRGLSKEERKHVLGGEFTLWGETMYNIFDLEWKAWPRGCATAEVLWLGDAKPDFDDFKRRMKLHRLRLLDNHINCAPLD